MRPEYLLLSNGNKSKSNKIIANILNKHFTTVGEKLAEELTQTDTNPISLMGNKNLKSIFLDEIMLHEVLEEISSIDPKKAMGYDDIPPKVIKWAPHIFGPILVKLFNKCLRLGYYPDGMKIARVVPIHKGGDINDVNNYR